MVQGGGAVSYGRGTPVQVRQRNRQEFLEEGAKIRYGKTLEVPPPNYSCCYACSASTTLAVTPVPRQPQNLNPTSTLNPEPYTPKPTPQTPNPKLPTPNPKPLTLNQVKRLESIKQRKLAELQRAGVPEKYLAELQNKKMG